MIDSDKRRAPDRAFDLGPAHEETLPWARALPGHWPFRVPRPIGSLGIGPAHEETGLALALGPGRLGSLKQGGS